MVGVCRNPILIRAPIIRRQFFDRHHRRLRPLAGAGGLMDQLLPYYLQPYVVPRQRLALAVARRHLTPACCYTFRRAAAGPRRPFFRSDDMQPIALQ